MKKKTADAIRTGRRLTPEEHREFMELSFAQERERLVKRIWQLRQDVDSYNENHNPGEPIIVVWNFTDDLAELDAARIARLS